MTGFLCTLYRVLPVTGKTFNISRKSLSIWQGIPVTFTVKLQGTSDTQGFPVHYTGYIIGMPVHFTGIPCQIERDFLLILKVFPVTGKTLYSVHKNPVNSL